jgi:predicted DNA binding CopG/RHH family protein
MGMGVPPDLSVFKSMGRSAGKGKRRAVWSTADSTEYIDWSKAQKLVLPNFRPTLRTISLRLPEWMIAELKLLANQRDVPYQSLLKVFLADKIKEERTGKMDGVRSSSRKRTG